MENVTKVFCVCGAVLMALTLGGCLQNAASPTPSPTASTTINSFTVAGTSAAVNGVVPINPAINSGAFGLSWDITSSDPYRVDVYLSNDTVLGTPSPLGTEDVSVLGVNCGTPASVYTTCSAAKATIACSFSSANVLVCGPKTSANPGKDITAFLTAIPKTANLLIQACNGLMDSCKTATVAVQLQ